MDGDTILLPEHVIKKLDEIYNMKKLEEAKMKQESDSKSSKSAGDLRAEKTS